ncbi:efflux transporter outer membrane subunit [Martelella alba]|nr:efflux transporter outer membrane subunit [Martelella alba]
MLDCHYATLGRAAFFVAVAGLAGGCTTSGEPPAATIKPVSSYQTAQSLKAGTSVWPGEGWWTQYGDPQLSALIEEGLRDAPDMRAAAARLAIADSGIGTAKSALLPSLNANASVDTERQSYNYLIGSDFVPKGWNDGGLAAISFNWQIDFWGRNRAALAAAKGDAAASAAEADAARLALSTGIAGVYAKLDALYAERNTTSRALNVRHQTVSLIADRTQQSLENDSALERVRAAEASTKAHLDAIDEQIALTRNQLAAMVGAGPDRGLSITAPKVSGKSWSGVPADLPLELVGRRPDIIAARMRVEAGGERVKVAQADFYPNINLAAVIGRQALGLDLFGNPDSTFGSAGPAISLPIFEGGRLEAAKGRAVANHDLAVANYDATLSEALKEVADAVVSKRQLRLRIADTQRAVTAASKAWQVTKDRYEGGLANYLEVLTAQDQLIDAEAAEAALVARSFALDIDMIRALGGGYSATETTK